MSVSPVVARTYPPEDGTSLEAPDEVLDALLQVVGEMRSGLSVSVVLIAQSVSTTEAAQLLRVSRPTVVKRRPPAMLWPRADAPPRPEGMLTAALDTCALWPSRQRDLLPLAVEGAHRPVWSAVVLDELRYEETAKLVARGQDPALAAERAARSIEVISARLADALAPGWEDLEGAGRRGVRPGVRHPSRAHHGRSQRERRTHPDPAHRARRPRPALCHG